MQSTRRPPLGITVFLSELRVSPTKSCADLADLVAFATWAKKVGFSSLWLGPLALMPAEDDIAPYTPESRCFIDPAYLPGLANVRVEVGFAKTEMAQGVIGELKKHRSLAARAILEAQWSDFEASCYFDPSAAERIARSLSSRHLDLAARVYWQLAYGADIDYPCSAAEELRTKVVLSQALGHGAMSMTNAIIPLGLDLPVGTSPGGVDAVEFEEWVLRGGFLGAPPDYFNPHGQSWGLVGYDLGAKGHSGALDASPLRVPLSLFSPVSSAVRIDHAIGLQQLCLVRDVNDLDAAQEPTYYVPQPREALVELLGRFSLDTGLLIVAEDLGVVPNGLRESLSSAGILLTKVLCFEDGDAATLHEASVVSLTTHDTNTARQLLGVCPGEPPEEPLRARAEMHVRAQRVSPLVVSNGFLAFVERNFDSSESLLRRDYLMENLPALVSALERSSSRIKLISLRDLCGECERLNLPGSTQAHRVNFFRPLGLSGEFLGDLCATDVLFEDSDF